MIARWWARLRAWWTGRRVTLPEVPPETVRLPVPLETIARMLDKARGDTTSPVLITAKGVLHRLPVLRNRTTGALRRGALVNPKTRQQKEMEAAAARAVGQTALSPRQKVKLRKALARATRAAQQQQQDYPDGQ